MGFCRAFGVALLVVAGGSLFPEGKVSLLAPQAIAQARPACAPPESDEYLVLVNQQTPESLETLRNVLPNGSTTVICQYLDDVVIRVGGFATEDVASAWGQYLNQTLSVQTAIVRPATPFAETDEAETALPEPQPQAATPVSAPEQSFPDYEPQLLEEGYAVLVDYADRSDIAIAVQDAIGESVGLAVYRQTPYLLVSHSDSARDAGKILTSLVESDFNAMIVDSRLVIQMTPAVAVSP